MPAKFAPKAQSPLEQIQDLTERVATLERRSRMHDADVAFLVGRLESLDKLVEALCRIIPEASPSTRAELVRFALAARA